MCADVVYAVFVCTGVMCVYVRVCMGVLVPLPGSTALRYRESNIDTCELYLL